MLRLIVVGLLIASGAYAATGQQSNQMQADQGNTLSQKKAQQAQKLQEQLDKQNKDSGSGESCTDSTQCPTGQFCKFTKIWTKGVCVETQN